MYWLDHAWWHCSPSPDNTIYSYQTTWSISSFQPRISTFNCCILLTASNRIGFLFFFFFGFLFFFLKKGTQECKKAIFIAFSLNWENQTSCNLEILTIAASESKKKCSRTPHKQLAIKGWTTHRSIFRIQIFWAIYHWKTNERFPSWFFLDGIWRKW